MAAEHACLSTHKKPPRPASPCVQACSLPPEEVPRDRKARDIAALSQCIVKQSVKGWEVALNRHQSLDCAEASGILEYRGVLSISCSYKVLA